MIILCLQIGPLLGIKSQGGVITSLGTVFSQFNPNTAALLVGALTLAVVFLTPKRISTWVPSPLIALVVITPLSMLLFQDGIPRIGTIPEGGLNFSLPNLKDHFPVLLRAGLVLAVLGAIDSLLTSLVADNISQSRHHSNRELIGQGIANSVAGLFNGLPGAGATMRTVINIKSGGRTPISGMAHSVFLLVLLLGAGPLSRKHSRGIISGNINQSRPRYYRLGISTKSTPSLHQDCACDVGSFTDDRVLGSHRRSPRWHVRCQPFNH